MKSKKHSGGRVWKIGLAIVLLVGLSMGWRFSRVHILARLGHAKSMAELGGAYADVTGEGLVTEYNWKKATYWLEKAGASGYGGADFTLYQMWQVQGDPVDIRRWLERGARNGNPECTLTLANSYRYGMHGFPKDKDMADYWSGKLPRWHP
ncbi:tetratricopeptide repeat protein [Holophaga foetida]|uniref:tetratricopeptide repeat protein n=1 Tax=Holophaga foetida TaxID=35839 RepID=UPI00024745E8|nr:sel1 repeat family protein [Holophaga foetida]